MDDDDNAQDDSAETTGSLPPRRAAAATPRGRPPSADGAAAPPPSSRAKSARAATLERNREAQRRFRERQRSRVHALERAAAEAHAREARLRADLASARARIAELEVALDVRGAPTGVPAGGGVPGTSPPSALGPVLAGPSGPAPDRAIVDKAVVMLGGDAAAGLENALTGSLTLSGGGVDGASVELTPAQIRALSVDDLVAYHHAHTATLASLLATLDGEKSSATEKEAAAATVARLARESTALYFRVLLAAPDTWVKLGRQRAAAAAAAAKGGVGGSQAPPATRSATEADPVWRTVATAMRLSPDQRAAMAALRRQLTADVAPLRARRQAAVDVLAATLAVRSSGFEHAAQTLSAAEAVADVRRAMKEEVLVRLAATHEMLNAVLTPVQLGRAFVAAFPRPPDGLAVALWVAAADSDADAAATLAGYGASLAEVTGRAPPALPAVAGGGPPPVTTGL